MVHGGPAARDIWRFNAESHVFAAAGFRCLQINFRGSTGRGRDFRLAGYGQWGDGMLRDLYAVVADGIERKTIDPRRIAFFGMSYGGYAALLAAADRPDLVRCAVAINPVCDLVSFAAEPPPFWRALAPTLRRQVGPAGHDQSPLHRLHAGAAPALLAWGARDPRIDTGDINRYLHRATETGARVISLRYADDGHLINEGRKHLFSEILAFLRRELS
jgi:dipeptidyl aminopeptidase/acylaminoacyl peptidase